MGKCLGRGGRWGCGNHTGHDGERELVVVRALAAADALVLLLPVQLLALGGAVGGVPAAVVDGLVLT